VPSMVHGNDEGADAIGAKARGTLPHGPTLVHVPGTGLVQRGRRLAGGRMYQARRPVLRFHEGVLERERGARAPGPYRAARGAAR
jgi:hypothetical protein